MLALENVARELGNVSQGLVAVAGIIGAGEYLQPADMSQYSISI
jgi:hypothetical protein